MMDLSTEGGGTRGDRIATLRTSLPMPKYHLSVKIERLILSFVRGKGLDCRRVRIRKPSKYLHQTHARCRCGTPYCVCKLQTLGPRDISAPYELFLYLRRRLILSLVPWFLVPPSRSIAVVLPLKASPCSSQALDRSFLSSDRVSCK